MWPILALTIVVMVVLVLLRRPPELAKLEVRRGSVRLKRGRLPGRLLDDFEDVLGDQAIADAEVRIIVEDARPRLLARGLGDAYLQRLRNVLGSYTVAQIRAGGRTSARSRSAR